MGGLSLTPRWALIWLLSGLVFVGAVDPPQWQICSVAPAQFLPAICVTFAIKDSCDATLDFALSSNLDAPFASQTFEPASLVPSPQNNFSCTALTPPAALTLLGCNNLCLSITVRHDRQDRTLACPVLNTSDCTALPEPIFSCKLAPQLDQPCPHNNTPPDNGPSSCADACTAPHGHCDEPSGYCLCEEQAGGSDCTLSCPLDLILQSPPPPDYTPLPMFSTSLATRNGYHLPPNTTHTFVVELASSPAGISVDKTLLSSAVAALVDQITAVGAWASVNVSASSAVALAASQGCPDLSFSSAAQPATQLSAVLFDPQRLFPLPRGVELWFLSLRADDDTRVSLQVYQPWFYQVPLTLLATAGISLKVAPQEDLFIAFSLAYPANLTLTVNSIADLPVAGVVIAPTTSTRPTQAPTVALPALSVVTTFESASATSNWTIGIKMGACPATTADCSSVISIALSLTASCSHDCVAGHGSCGYDGTCQCLREWTGDDCSVPVCAPACGPAGTCTEPGVCTCTAPDYGGPYCVDFIGNSSVSSIDYDPTASTVIDFLLPAIIIFGFLLLVPSVFWLVAKREQWLLRPVYDIV
jgi:hypothetical protein